MNFRRWLFWLWLAFTPWVARATDAPVDFAELRALLRANLPGVSDADFDRAASVGLLAAFTNQVRWEPAPTAATTNSAPLVASYNMVEKNFAVLRVGRVAAGLDAALAAAEKNLAASNRILGVVVDLRFADGEDAAAAQRAAEISGLTPRAVLVNAATRGAAVTLAVELRVRRALLLGAHTAGDVAAWRTFTLRDGRRLQITTNATALAAGVEPDIVVNVLAADEKLFLADAYAELPKTNLSSTTTNHTSPRVTEADLVRARREGAAEPEEELAAAEAAPAAASVHALRDPVLARAVDLLRGLALVRTAK
ncbi:MAG: hypothetical protein RLZZ350_235 [Verrucomicrobiota bacterium]|jgi:hypothetical protein